MNINKKILILVLSLFFVSCKKKTQNGNNPVLVNIVVQKYNIPMSPNTNISEEELKNRIIKSVTHSDFKLALNQSPSKFKKPFEIIFKWSIRPTQRTGLKIIKGRKVNRLIEAYGEIILRPLFRGKDEILKFASAKAIRFSATETKKLDFRLKSAVYTIIDELGNSLWLEKKLMKADIHTLINYLHSENLSQRKLAVNIIGKRKLKKAGKTLVEMLKKENDVSFVMRIAGVLGILKEKTAIKPLSDLALSMPPEHTIAIMHIIASIGGEDAETFLHWLENSHDNKDVRKAAHNLLDEMAPSSQNNDI